MPAVLLLQPSESLSYQILGGKTVKNGDMIKTAKLYIIGEQVSDTLDREKNPCF